MTASELFKAGRLQEALDAQLKDVKANPADRNKRLFLFELAAFTGDLERAQRQIDALTYEDPDLTIAHAAYRQCLQAEQARRKLFRDGVPPTFLMEPPDHVRLRLDAINRIRENRPAEASALLLQANAAAPAIKGSLNGKAFKELRDLDDLFGPVLEVFSHDKYLWIPLEQVDYLAMNPPRHPRDLLWYPAHLEISNGPGGDVFLPVLYPLTHGQGDEQLKLGRMTDWQTLEGGAAHGIGARLFLVDDLDVPLLEWRLLQMASEEDAAPEGEAAP